VLAPEAVRDDVVVLQVEARAALDAAPAVALEDGAAHVGGDPLARLEQRVAAREAPASAQRREPDADERAVVDLAQHCGVIYRPARTRGMRRCERYVAGAIPPARAISRAIRRASLNASFFEPSSTIPIRVGPRWMIATRQWPAASV